MEIFIMPAIPRPKSQPESFNNIIIISSMDVICKLENYHKMNREIFTHRINTKNIRRLAAEVGFGLLATGCSVTAQPVTPTLESISAADATATALTLAAPTMTAQAVHA